MTSNTGTDQSTLTEDSDSPDEAARVPRVLGLALAWCAQQPERVGEVCLLPAGNPGQPRVFGRGPAAATDQHRRVFPQQQGPDVSLQGAPLTNPFISREQLVLTGFGDRMRVENIGRCAAFRNGESFQDAELELGDVLRLGKQMLLVAVKRPAWLRRTKAESSHQFGRADADGIVGESPRVWDVRRSVRELGQRPNEHVLVLGQSGTGKELVAQALHRASACSARPLVARNAATLPEGIIDAELFGNAKNFPNAGMPERPGLIGQADGSTLFLDEFGELPTALQVHLLRVLDAGEYQRLGESKSRKASFRLVAATNRSLEALRDDVLARFSARLTLPALRDRKEDIPLIARHVYQSTDTASPPASAPTELPIAFVEELLYSDFPGNVRDLTRAVQRFRSEPHGDWEEQSEPRAASVPPPPRAATIAPESITQEALRASLEEHGWVQEKVWRALGLSSRHALARLLKKYAIEQR